jgi:chemotaxis protein methyltransferase CheR
MNATFAPPISDEAFHFLTEYVYRHSRIRLGRDKKSLVVSRVTKRLRHLQLSSFEEYCRLLQKPDGKHETLHLVDVISTNHTHFFREKEHFDFLQSIILPQWLADKANHSTTLRLWSAACSSGEEPYTIAMVLAEFLHSRPDIRWHIDGTDICTRIIERATAAVYEIEKLSFPSPELMPRYFQKGVGQHAGYCRVKPELQQRVTFHHLNLFQDSYPFNAGLDVIFCRNVMIYFDPTSTHTLVNRLASQLRPGGYLIVGLSESLLGINHPLKQVRPGIYLKR